MSGNSNNDEFNEILNEIQNKVDNVLSVCNSVIPEKNKKLKLLFVSTHTNQTNGYSKVSFNILNSLKDKLPWLDIVHFALQGLGSGDVGRKLNNSIRVINGSSLEKKHQGGFAFSELANTIRVEKPDIVMIYNDISVICAYLEELKKVHINHSYKIWAYIDTLYSSYPQQMIDIINRDVSQIFCFTKQWKNVLKKHNINRPISIIPHGIDRSVIKMLPKDIARQSVGLPKDAFIFTSFNRNHPRKRYDIMIMAFVELIIKHPTKPIFLMIVADKGNRGGYQLFDIFARELKLRSANIEQFGNRLLITATDNVTFKDNDINLLYNVADAGLSCSEAEGWGLCPFEQMCIGIPQIVPNIHGFTEYCNSNNSILVDTSSRYYLPLSYSPMCGEGAAIDYFKLCGSMERLIFDEGFKNKLSENATKELSSDKYKWENCISELVSVINSEVEDI